MIKPSIQLRLGQQLAMTPQLQQAIRLLQYSTLELQTHIQEILESNPLLDSEEDSEEGYAADTAERDDTADQFGRRHPRRATGRQRLGRHLRTE